MPTQRQLVRVPLTQGIGEDADPRMRPPERLRIARNVRAHETGTLGTRYGFTALTDVIAGTVDTISDEGPVRALAATQRELLAIGHRSLYSWSPALAGWLYRGHVSPCRGRQRELYRSTADYGLADSAPYSDVVIHAARRQERRESGGIWSSIECRMGLVATGAAIGQPVELDGSATTTIPWGPLCATTGAGVVIIYAYGSAVGSHDLRRAVYDGSTPTVAPVAYDTIAASDVPAASDDGRMWDALGLADGAYVVAWVDAAHLIQLRRYSAAHALEASGSITIDGSFYRVTLAQQCAEAEPVAADRELYVAVEAFVDPSYYVYAYKRNPLTLAAVAGPQGIRGLGSVARATNLGCASGIDQNGDEAVAVSWLYKNINPPWVRNTESNHTDNTLTTLGDLAVCYNSAPLSRPWWYRTRCYSHLETVHPDMIVASGFETHMMADHEIGTGANRQIRIAAMWGVGAAIGSSTQLLQGTANHVWLNGTEHRFLCPFLAEVIKADADDWLSSITHRVAYDEVALDFDAIPSACMLGRSMAIVGGGYVSLYDGMSTAELGFACPPLFDTCAAAGSGGAPAAGTYSYQAMWTEQRGELLHRGLPGPTTEVVLAAPENVLVDCYTLPATRRAQPDAHVYRAGLDAIPRRVNRVGVVLDGSIAAATTWTLTDEYNDADLYIALYTTGGTLEAVAPEGARFPVVIRDRLHLLDFFRGDRLQFSKGLAPGAAGELAIAPELYEALGRISADGSPLVAAAPLDNATAVFSESAVYLLGGVGPDGRGVGDDMSPLVMVHGDSGCTEPRSVVAYPDGVMFLSARGIYQLGRDHTVGPVGEAVRDLTDAYPVVTSAVVVPTERQVRFTVTDAAETDGRILVYDYRLGEWFEWHVLDSMGAVVVPRGGGMACGVYYILSAAGVVWYEDTSTHLDAARAFVPAVIETAEIQPAGPQAWMRVGLVSVLGEYLDPHGVTVSLYYDGSAVAAATHSWSNAEIAGLPNPSAREQLAIRPARQKCSSLRVRVATSSSGTPVTGAALDLHMLTLSVALYGGADRGAKRGRK